MMKPATRVFALVFLFIPPTSFAQDMGIVDAQATFKTITIDGDFGDWEGIAPACTDAEGDGGAHFDFAAAYLANDDEYLYFRITFAEPSAYPDAFWFMNVGFNSDVDSSTGFDWGVGAGAEFVVQGPKLFDQRSGNFNDTEFQSEENDWGAFAYADVAPMETTTDVEFALRRDIVFENDENGMPGLLNPDGAPLFEFEDFIVVFETEDLDYNWVEWMPDRDSNNQSGVYYIFATGPVSVSSWQLH